MSDDFSAYAGAPARRVVAVTPSDTDDLADTLKGLYVGTMGDVTLIAAGTSAVAPGECCS